MMKNLMILTMLLLFCFSNLSAQEEVLVFYKTDGFYHKSIPTGIKAIEELGEENNFKVTVTEKANEFSNEKLEKYDLVIFLNTTGDVLDEGQQEAFETYMGNGGNFFGIHAAADTEYDWEWYGDLVGAYFVSHPKITEAVVEVKVPDHPTLSHLPETWKRKDEWYNYKNINPNNTVLLNLDETSYEGGTNGENHPIAWYKELPGGGIAYYTGGGHTHESYSEPAFREHLLRTIFFSLGRNQE